jgi:hypothetical protein
MPTPVLPLLHQLLRLLHIPIFPPNLSSVSPSLLLILLESLLGHRLDLTPGLRTCETTEAEISVIKCILGVLADDLLAMDLTLVDPRKIVAGAERELEVVVMAYAVVAKRKGLDLRVPQEEEEVEFDWSLEEEETASSSRLQDPIEPDVSFSSPIMEQDDVFMASHTLPTARKAGTDRGEEASGREKEARQRTVLDEILEEFGS